MPRSTASRCPSRAGAPSMPERPPAASPTACSSAAPPTSTPSTSATGSSTPRLRADARVTVLEHTNVRTLTPAELRAADPAFEPCPLVVADLSFISLRSVVPALTAARRRARRRPGPPGQAPVRGGPRRRLAGQGRRARPRPLAGRARGRGVRARRRRNRHHGGDGLPPDRRRRQRRVPGARPQGRGGSARHVGSVGQSGESDESGEAAALFAAAVSEAGIARPPDDPAG